MLHAEQVASVVAVLQRLDGAAHVETFRRPVVPGDQLVFDVEVVAARRTFAKIHGRATVDGELVCEAEMMSAMVGGS